MVFFFYNLITIILIMLINPGFGADDKWKAKKKTGHIQPIRIFQIFCWFFSKLADEHHQNWSRDSRQYGSRNTRASQLFLSFFFTNIRKDQ